MRDLGQKTPGQKTIGTHAVTHFAWTCQAVLGLYFSATFRFSTGIFSLFITSVMNFLLVHYTSARN